MLICREWRMKRTFREGTKRGGGVTNQGKERLRRVLRNDPGMGVIRHADAGYDVAKDTLRNNDLDFKERLK